MISKQKILISGAGIAGLTAALCLAQKGFSVELFEKARAFESIGAGIQISPNAMHILQKIGIGDAIERRGFNPLAVALTASRSGKVITRFPLGHAMRHRHGAPNIVIHRAELQAILVEACRASSDIRIHMATEIEHIENGEDGVSISASRGMIKTGTALVCAEGIWSDMRARIEGASTPQYSGLMATRALIDLAQLPPEVDRVNTRLWLAKNVHAVHYPVNETQLNVVIITPEPDAPQPAQSQGLEDIWQPESVQTDAENLRGTLKGWHKNFTCLFDSNASWSRWPLYTVDPKGVWSDRSIIAIGDAAHASLPFAAQGGACAIEDAAVLAQHLASNPAEPASAIEAYTIARRPRVEKLWQQANKNRKIYHMGALGALPRNTVMRLTSRESLQKRMDWIYGWSPEPLGE